MATSDRSALLRLPAQLVVNPTSLSVAFPYGGTSLGLVKDVALVCEKFSEPVAEESNGVRVWLDELDLGEQWGIVAVLRAQDEGVVKNFFTGQEVGASTGDTGIVYPQGSPPSGQDQPGTWLGNRSLSVLLAPIDPMQWFFYAKRATARVKASMELRHSVAVEGGVPVVFHAIPPNSAVRTVQWRPKEDITL